MSDEILVEYTTTSGTRAVLAEPDMELTERAMALVPASTPAMKAVTLQRRETLRLCLRSINGRKVTYQELQGAGLLKAFPGARGLRDVQQLEAVLDKLGNTSLAEDAAVFRTARPVDAATGVPAAGPAAAAEAEAPAA
jgi:hypothetical protein